MAEETLARRNVAVESGSDLMKPVADQDLLFAVGLEVLEDGRIDHGGGVDGHVGQYSTWRQIEKNLYKQKTGGVS